VAVPVKGRGWVVSGQDVANPRPESGRAWRRWDGRRQGAGRLLAGTSWGSNSVRSSVGVQAPMRRQRMNRR
jgi:hypothetical protein